jgi:hypothetical protein
VNNVGAPRISLSAALRTRATEKTRFTLYHVRDIKSVQNCSLGQQMREAGLILQVSRYLRVLCGEIPYKNTHHRAHRGPQSRKTSVSSMVPVVRTMSSAWR